VQYVSAPAIVLAAPLILEFVFAPINLWTGRTTANFVRFTGYDPRIATTLFAPIKLITAALLAVGLIVPGVGVAGAVGALAVSVGYLARLSARGRRDPSGLVGFALFGALAAALLAVLLI
jgi:hypothetical protein